MSPPSPLGSSGSKSGDLSSARLLALSKPLRTIFVQATTPTIENPPEIISVSNPRLCYLNPDFKMCPPLYVILGRPLQQCPLPVSLPCRASPYLAFTVPALPCPSTFPNFLQQLLLSVGSSAGAAGQQLVLTLEVNHHVENMWQAGVRYSSKHVLPGPRWSYPGDALANKDMPTCRERGRKIKERERAQTKKGCHLY